MCKKVIVFLQKLSIRWETDEMLKHIIHMNVWVNLTKLKEIDVYL